ncbi:MAG: hypothetical protein Cons2KO_20570 [Congregibacter sp.]
MSTPRSITRLNDNLPPFLQLFKGRIASVDLERQTVEMRFEVGTDLCHSVDIVQGGFITAMLDAAMSHALFACDDTVVGVSSLEISTRYLEATRAGRLRATGRIVRLSYKTAFVEGELFDEAGKLLATTQSVAKVARKKAA